MRCIIRFFIICRRIIFLCIMLRFIIMRSLSVMRTCVILDGAP